MGDNEDNDRPGTGPSDEIKPYKVHVSSRYLELTKQKLELTRLPHEGKEPKSVDWWEPKPQVESLVDHWLERYSWRDQEKVLNENPQFRTAISIASSETPLRLHFIHVPSPHANALPLLLIPPFPFSNLTFSHLAKPFTDPEDAATNQPFHLVIPALPGLGFSDPFPNNTAVISAAAEMLNTLMSRLDYQHYLVSNTGAAQSSPAKIDWKLVNCLATQYSTCLGAHFISPPLASPKLSEAPLEWAKWSIASFFHAGILGYSKNDFSALYQASSSAPDTTTKSVARRERRPPSTQIGMNKFGLREPNTLAYAMCDSPTGLLVVVLKGLRLLGPRMQFTPEQIITFTELAWLPGPEYAMRFWAAAHQEHTAQGTVPKDKKAPAIKPKVAITVFLGGKDDEEGQSGSNGEADGAIPLESIPLKESADVYACPAWGNAHYRVLFSQRTPGKPGLLAWERPEVISAGVRGLARELLKVDQRLLPASAPEPPVAPLEEVVVPTTPVAQAEAEAGGLQVPQRPGLELQGDSSKTAIGSQPPSSPQPKGKELEAISPGMSIPSPDEQRDDEEERAVREGTPDTVVLVTAPKDSAV